MFQLLLAVDTSGKNGSLALARAAAGQGESEIVCLKLCRSLAARFRRNWSRRLPRCSKSTDIARPIWGICGRIRPGSFTGLRVGLAAIKALAEALRKPIVAISLLEAVACGGAARGRVFAALDAGRGDVYAGDYELAPTPLTPHALLCTANAC